MFLAVTLAPLLVTVALQAWLTVWPLANVQVAVQPVIAELPAVTLTSPWKAPSHWPTIEYEAVQPRPLGEGEVDRDGDGEIGGVSLIVTGGVLEPYIVASLAVALMPLVPLKIRCPHEVSWLTSKFTVMS